MDFSNNKIPLLKKLNPFIQGIFAFVALFALSLICYILVKLGWIKETPMLFWEISICFLFAFGLFNAIIGISHSNTGHYFLKSVAGFIGIALSGILLAGSFGSLSFWESKTIQWMYFIFSFGYLVMHSIVRIIKTLMEAAQRQQNTRRNQ